MSAALTPRCGENSGSEHYEVRRARSDDRFQRNCPVEGYESAAMSDRQREEVGVGDLAGTVDSQPVEDLLVEQAQIARPEFMVLVVRGARQAGDRERRRHRARITRLADHPHEAVLGQGARSPAVMNLRPEPEAGPGVIDVIRIEEGNEDVDVEERPLGEPLPDRRQRAEPGRRALHSGSSSRSWSMTAFEIAGPRCGNGSKP